MKKNQTLLKTILEMSLREKDQETNEPKSDDSQEKKSDDPQAKDDEIAQLAAAFKSTSVEDFVNKFKTIATDPKVLAVLKAGQTDGDKKDEALKYSEISIGVSTLKPTQNEIGFNESIQNVLTDKFGSLKSIFGGQASVGGPIVTYNGKWIIDGHHRWSQVFAVNPQAKMKALNIQGNLAPAEILKVVHAAIAANTGKLPLSKASGINIMNGVNRKEVEDAVNKNLSDAAKKIWAENGFKDNKAVANHLFGNLSRLVKNNKPMAGAPPRTSMPQTAATGKEADKLDMLSKGIVNFKDPKSSDVQKEIRTLQERAGIRGKYRY